MEGGKGHSLQRSFDSPIPKGIEIGRANVGAFPIPKAKVKLHRDGQLGVEKITPPLKARITKHGGKMVAGSGLNPLDRFVAEPCDRVAGTEYGVWRAVEIDVRLSSQSRMFHIAGPLRETLQHQVIHVCAANCR